MSSENKKLVWIAVAVVGFILLIVVGLVFVFAPNSKKGGASAPAAIGNTSAPKAEQPGEYLAVPSPASGDSGAAQGAMDAQDQNGIAATAAAAGGQVSDGSDGSVPDAPGAGNQAASGQSGINTNNGDIIVIYGDKPQLSTSNAKDAGAGSQSTAGQSVSTPTAGGTASAGAKQSGTAQKPQSTASSSKPPVTASKPKPAGSTVSKKQSTQTKVQASFWIQAASFSNRAKAEDLKDRLAGSGISALIASRDISGKVWYRVRIGPYSTKKEAEGWLSRIRKMPDCSQASIWQ